MNSIIVNRSRFAYLIARDFYSTKGLVITDYDTVINEINELTDEVTNTVNGVFTLSNDIIEKVKKVWNITIPFNDHEYKRRLKRLASNSRINDIELFAAANGIDSCNYMHNLFIKIKYYIKESVKFPLTYDPAAMYNCQMAQLKVNRYAIKCKIYCTTHIYTFQYRADNILDYLFKGILKETDIYAFHIILFELQKTEMATFESELRDLTRLLCTDDSSYHIKLYFPANFRVYAIQYKYAIRLRDEIINTNKIALNDYAKYNIMSCNENFINMIINTMKYRYATLKDDFKQLAEQVSILDDICREYDIKL